MSCIGEDEKETENKRHPAVGTQLGEEVDRTAQGLHWGCGQPLRTATGLPAVAFEKKGGSWGAICSDTVLF